MTQPWITKPDRYDLTDEEYHADPVVGGSLSSSGARTLATKCPAKYTWEREHGRPDTGALEFGRAYHSLALSTGAPVVEVKAKTLTGAAAAKDADRIRSDGATPIATPDLERAHGMAAALRTHEIVGPLLARPGRAEQSYVARDPETGVMCRARIDWQPDVDDAARVIVVDLKSARSAHPVAFARSMAEFGYHQQGPFYEDVLSWLGLDHGLPPTFVLVAQEKEPPYLVTVADLDEQAVEWGRLLNRKARHVYARCTAAGEWPGYDHGPSGVARLSLPGWQIAQYEAAEMRGEFDFDVHDHHHHPIGDVA